MALEKLANDNDQWCHKESMVGELASPQRW
jgi:hypothetical protein